ncbi:ketopantoate reductase family protein [Paenibacillus sp. CF384]|uniref:ketopantoate reductase family protein n=1 Tax=Paenibacillus sp. CF384 TaxID=1884382 RepID=UPI00089C8868|nr:2-dehydropantoate 2-reductase [Paenibacillus sp. CF384]SDW48122.1 ketopantoate reductase [Paenibacillus sp. CF384]
MIAVIGAGAMGGMLAARLKQAGHEVTLVDVSEALVNQINEYGLVVSTKDGNAETIHVPATSNLSDVGIVDTVFFFVKAQHTVSAAELALPLVGEDTTIVSLQNGWGNADTLSEQYQADRIVVGITYHSATVIGLGHVAHTGMGATFVGPYVDGASLARAERIGLLLNDAGIQAQVTSFVKTEVWKKLILNAATLPTSALTGLCAGDQGESGKLLELVDDLAKEATAVARALGYDIDADERVTRIHTILSGAGKGKSSMLQDAEARRKTEIEVINGAVVRAAERTNVAVPLNTAMVALISGLEKGWRG